MADIEQRDLKDRRAGEGDFSGGTSFRIQRAPSPGPFSVPLDLPTLESS
jgi:hypothetical protein